ncbi:MAG: hypothetical protein ABSF44_13910 [Candidatus Bathyarchaeia archaeon]|jgi:hypothetical protein
MRRGTPHLTWEKNSDAEKKAYLFFDAVISLLERVWMSKQDWSDWKKWAGSLLTNGIFMDVFNDNKGSMMKGSTRK